MQKLRIRYQKREKASYLSHLDINRIFSRAFSRADIPIAFSNGFNPRPLFSFSMPLSLFYQSKSEFLDFESDMEKEEIKKRLNEKLPSGIRVDLVYEPLEKLSAMQSFCYRLEITFQKALADDDIKEMQSLFLKSELILLKKTKRGEEETDILPLIENVLFLRSGENSVTVQAILFCCDNKSLNPEYLVKAVTKHLPDLTVELFQAEKQCVYGKNDEIFE